MSVAAHRLAGYYRSDHFSRDYPSLVRRNPDAAMTQLRSIIDKLKENYAALGKHITADEADEQAQFAAGALQMDQMLRYLKIYADSIMQRWPLQS